MNTALKKSLFTLSAAALLVWLPICVFADDFVTTTCIDYTQLTDASVCTCYYGSFSNPRQRTGVRDYGSGSSSSRHTVHRDTLERDGRTANRLRTIPAGDTASVRLGNWEATTEGEAIEYAFTPDSTFGDMLVLKYAVVMANPNTGHTEDQKPRFLLQILDASGRQITGRSGCFEADFTPGSNALGRDGWYSNNYNTGSKVLDVWWKDWTTVFVPLQDYAGQQLRIRLTTKDCAHVSHFGYAYFSMYCKHAKLEGDACSGEGVHFEAPEGYTYLWYKKSNPSEVLRNPDGSRKTVDAYGFDLNPGDTAVYCVNVYSETGCYVTLEANPNAQELYGAPLTADTLRTACPDQDRYLEWQLYTSEYDSVVVQSDAAAQAAGFNSTYVYTPDQLPDSTIRIPLPGADGALDRQVRAGRYTFHLTCYADLNECSRPQDVDAVLQVNYPAAAVVQRGNYLFLRNEANNGGYDWTQSTFQWYCNGSALRGQTGSQLLMDAPSSGEYYCLITGPDGIGIPTCAVGSTEPVFSALDFAEAEHARAIRLHPGQTMVLEGVGRAELYDMTGRLIGRFATADAAAAAATAAAAVTAPSATGLYLLKSDSATWRIIVQ